MLKINIPSINEREIKEKIISEMQFLQAQITLHSQENVIWSNIQEQIKYFQGFINTAKSRAEIRDSWPNSLNKFPFILLKPFGIIFFNIFNFLFRDQREVNFNILSALEESVKLNQIILEQIKSITSTSQEELNTVKFISSDFQNKYKDLEKKINNLEQKHSQEINNLEQKYSEKVNNLEQKHSQEINNLEQKQEDIFYKTIYLQEDLIQQKQLINIFLNQLSGNKNQKVLNQQIKKIGKEKFNYLDSFYLALENKFRGKREDIKEQQKTDYLSLLQKLNINGLESQILDIGCGRGEWLEVLKDYKYNAKGIDLNKIMVSECCARGFDVINQDCVDYLKSLSKESLNLITGFHLIEHLPFNILWELLAESLRALKSGGLIIFETPNPDNVLVGSRNFYIDPTHRNPLPSVMIKFLVESIGFINVEIMNLHPISDQKIDGGELAHRFNEYFYCSQDYAVIGYKP
ncbi:methyltransferase domain-containing protein [Geminocystis sp.]|uniref:class I SAM-dependent methyltransferase n=1 Tax=Geminocystis sp. TaxID=2664100 RepID=UPI003593C12B